MQHILILKIIISTTFLQFIIEISFLFIINMLPYIYNDNGVNITFLFNLTFTLKENLKELKHLKG